MANGAEFEHESILGHTHGFVCADNVAIGSLAVETQDFGATTSLPFYSLTKPFDGVLGLGLGYDSFTNVPLFLNLSDQGMLDAAVFSMYLNDDVLQPELVLGGINDDHFEGPLTNLSLLHNARWEIALDKFTFGDHVLPFEKQGILFNVASQMNAFSWPLVALIGKEIGAVENGSGQLQIDCSKKLSLPDMTWTMSGHNFSMTASEYILEQDGTCYLALAKTPERRSDEPIAVLGSSFMRKWYTVFNFEDKNIGLALAK